MSDKDEDKVQGEGDYDAARNFNESAQDFVESGKADSAPDPAEQSDETSKSAEAEGKARAKEFDPEVHRDPKEPTKSGD